MTILSLVLLEILIGIQRLAYSYVAIANIVEVCIHNV
jgi:hypothetical protein